MTRPLPQNVIDTYAALPNEELHQIIRSELSGIILENATINIVLIDPAPYSLGGDAQESRYIMDQWINDLRSESLFASHYVAMMQLGIDNPVLIERKNGDLDLLDGEARCTIAMARGEMIPAIIIENAVYGEPSPPALISDDIDF